MIVLITGSSRAQECAAAIEQKTHLKTEIAASLKQAVEMLRRNDYKLLVLDESFQQVDPAGGDAVMAAAGGTMPVYINLAIHGAQRVAKEVQCALHRQAQEAVLAMRAAQGMLRNDLRGELTALLLNCELAMQENSLPQDLAGRLNAMHALAEKMRGRLEQPS